MIKFKGSETESKAKKIDQRKARSSSPSDATVSHVSEKAAKLPRHERLLLESRNVPAVPAVPGNVAHDRRVGKMHLVRDAFLGHKRIVKSLQNV